MFCPVLRRPVMEDVQVTTRTEPKVAESIDTARTDARAALATRLTHGLRKSWAAEKKQQFSSADADAAFSAEHLLYRCHTELGTTRQVFQLRCSWIGPTLAAYNSLRSVWKQKLRKAPAAARAL